MSSESKGVSNCYVFKSRLQEYAQKVGFSTPVYETIKEGPSHQPFFKSTVIVNDVRYDSLPEFSNRKAAEQSAAEIALMELVKSGEMKECISQPVHETGLCKNLLQEYAQKMNFAMPAYECKRHDTAGRAAPFSCTVDIGGIRYIGATARTKKEAEIKAARTALLAIQSTPSEAGETPNEEIRYTVVPTKRKEPETTTSEQDAAKARKQTKGRFKRKSQKMRQSVGLMPADPSGQAACVPSGDGLLATPMPDCVPLALDPTGILGGPPTMGLNMSHQHEGSSTLQDGSILSSNGFSNSQMLECQPALVAATGAVHNPTMNQGNEGGSPNPSFLQTGGAVGCGSQNSQQHNNGGSSGHDHCSAPLSDSSPLFSSDGFSNSQVSDFQTLSKGATWVVQIDKPNTDSTLKDGSSEVSAVDNNGSIQKSDAVKQPEGHGDDGNNSEAKDYSSVAVEQVLKCQPASVAATGAVHDPTVNQCNVGGPPNPTFLQTSSAVGCGVQKSQQRNNGGSSGHDHCSAPLSDYSPLFSSDGFSDSQVSGFQPLSEGATGAVQMDKPDTSSEVPAVSLVNNSDCTQKSDVGKQPEGHGDDGNNSEAKD